MPLNDTLLLMATEPEAHLLEANLARKHMAEGIPPARSPRATRATTIWRSIVALAWRALRPAPARHAAPPVR